MEGFTLQVFATFTICLSHMNIGLILQFPSAIISDIEHHNSTMFSSNISLTESQGDMMGSLVGLGAFSGSVAVPFISKFLGRKRILIIFGIGAVACWLGIALFQTVYAILIARFVSGFAAAIHSVIGATYNVEVVDSKVRGLFWSFLVLAVVIGQAVSASASFWLHYYELALLNSVFTALFLVCIVFIPESPGYLILKGKEKKATKTLNKLRSNDHAAVTEEIEIYRHLNAESKERSVIEGLIQPLIWRKICVIFVLLLIRAFGGFDILLANSFRILKSMGSSLDESLASIIVFTTQIPCSLIFSFCLIDRIGRRRTLFFSCAIVFLTQLSLAAFLFFHGREGSRSNEELQVTNQSLAFNELGNGTGMNDSSSDVVLEEAISWLPVIFLSMSLAGFYFGLQSVPFILMTEFFPTWIRPQAASICTCVCAILQFTTLQLYTVMSITLSPQGLYLFMAVVAFSGIPFTYFFVEETMGEKIG